MTEQHTRVCVCVFVFYACNHALWPCTSSHRVHVELTHVDGENLLCLSRTGVITRSQANLFLDAAFGVDLVVNLTHADEGGGFAL